TLQNYRARNYLVGLIVFPPYPYKYLVKKNRQHCFFGCFCSSTNAVADELNKIIIAF
ncbi:hypothetical protein L9F63_005471, partial [Diploptera punctata]